MHIIDGTNNKNDFYDFCRQATGKPRTCILANNSPRCLNHWQLQLANTKITNAFELRFYNDYQLFTCLINLIVINTCRKGQCVLIKSLTKLPADSMGMYVACARPYRYLHSDVRVSLFLCSETDYSQREVMQVTAVQNLGYLALAENCFE